MYHCGAAVSTSVKYYCCCFCIIFDDGIWYMRINRVIIGGMDRISVFSYVQKHKPRHFFFSFDIESTRNLKKKKRLLDKHQTSIKNYGIRFFLVLSEIQRKNCGFLIQIYISQMEVLDLNIWTRTNSHVWQSHVRQSHVRHSQPGHTCVWYIKRPPNIFARLKMPLFAPDFRLSAKPVTNYNRFFFEIAIVRQWNELAIS